MASALLSPSLSCRRGQVPSPILRKLAVCRLIQTQRTIQTLSKQQSSARVCSYKKLARFKIHPCKRKYSPDEEGDLLESSRRILRRSAAAHLSAFTQNKLCP